MINKSSKIWLNVLDLTRTQIGNERFNLWFKNVRMSGYNEGIASIVVPNVFIKTWFEENFLSIIKENLQTVTNKDVDVEFTVGGTGFKNEIAMSTPAPSGKRDSEDSDDDGSSSSCDSQLKSSCRVLTLNDFVVGNCNRLAYASALELINPTNNSYNALFIHGQVGVGKTHLLQGIWNMVKKSGNSKNVAYLAAECWTNEFIHALKNGKLDSFRHKYRNMDILLIDDVHFVSSKPGVQEELLHTFNMLHGMSKRIVFASDSHPKFIYKLKESLSSRFMTGMVTKIESPDVKTAYLILDSKLKIMKKEFPAVVIEYMAETFLSNVRDLECALTTVLAVSNITKKRIDVEMVKDALDDQIPKQSRTRTVTIKDIEKSVIKHFNITLADIHSSKRVAYISQARQTAMYLSSILTNLSRQQIGNHFGGKKHTTVIHAIKKIKERIEKDQELNAQIERLKASLCKGED